MKTNLLTLILVLLLTAQGFSSPSIADPLPLTPQGQPSSVFSEIQNGILNSNIELLTKHITEQTYLSLFGVKGYFSVNQSYYILEDFFMGYRPIAFKFTEIKSENNPYAIGELLYESKSKRETAKVYVSLRQQGNEWKIAQFSVK